MQPSTQYHRFDRTTSLVTANLVGIGLGAVPAIALYIGHILYNGNLILIDDSGHWWSLILFLILIVVGIIVHELLHALGWILAGRVPFSAIKFGVDRETLSPYAHLRQPLPINPYRFGVVLPAIGLGLLPAAIGIIGNLSLFTVYGAFFTLTAGGDFLVLWLLRNDPPQALATDHPERVGCEVLIPVDNSST
jgi:hypothetical protein